MSPFLILALKNQEVWKILLKTSLYSFMKGANHASFWCIAYVVYTIELLTWIFCFLWGDFNWISKILKMFNGEQSFQVNVIFLSLLLINVAHGWWWPRTTNNDELRNDISDLKSNLTTSQTEQTDILRNIESRIRDIQTSLNSPNVNRPDTGE